MADPIKYGKPPPDAGDSPFESSDPAKLINAAGDYGNIGAAKANIEKKYESAVSTARNWLGYNLAYPVSWPYLGYALGLGIPPTIPDAASLVTAAVAPEVTPELSEGQAAVTSPGARFLYSSLSRGLPPAVAGGVSAAEVGLPVVPNAISGYLTGMTGAVSDKFGDWRANRENSPYMIREQRAGTSRFGDVLQKHWPNLFGHGPVNNGMDILNIFDKDASENPYIQQRLQQIKAIKGNSPGAKAARQSLQNQVDYLKKPYEKLAEFFGDPDNYSQGVNPSVSFSKFKRWLYDNRKTFADAKISIGAAEDMISAVYGLDPGVLPRFLGFDVYAEGGSLGGRLHSFAQHGTGGYLPFNPGLHYSFGKSGRAVGNYPQLDPSMTKRVLFEGAVNRVASSLNNPEETLEKGKTYPVIYPPGGP